ncbi:MAG: hypothetical protein WC285_02680 [Candidatus Gracilibacteria bacterium]|jgi:hypothetical protein
MENTIKKTDDSEFIKNLVSGGAQEQNILDVAPELDKSLIEDVAPPKSILAAFLKGFSALLFVSGVVIAGFFTLQLTDVFQIVNQRLDIPNLAMDLSLKNQDVIRNQVDVNVYRYLQAKAYLDKFSYDADSYLQNYAIYNNFTVSKDEKDAAKQAMADIRSPLKESFLAAREKLILPLSSKIADDGSNPGVNPDQPFIDATVTKLQTKAAELANSTDDAAKLDYKNYLYAAGLVSNEALRQAISKVDFDKLSDEELKDLIKSVDLLAVNDFSIVQKIKDTRIKWSDIIHEIDLRTIIADENYTKDDYESYGGIRYTSYSFDTDSKQISLIGETKKNDTTTFSTISNLIDSLNGSKIFGSAEMRSFSKSGSAEEGYTSSLRISFKLKDEEKAPTTPTVPVIPISVVPLEVLK